VDAPQEFHIVCILRRGEGGVAAVVGEVSSVKLGCDEEVTMFAWWCSGEEFWLMRS
jgi:hypothetical protein